MKVIGLLRYNTFKELFEDFDIEIMADKSMTKQELLNVLEEIYTQEKQKEYGVLGIRIQRAMKITLLKQNYVENKKLYGEIEVQLRKKLTEDIPITHVGSTAIPDMYGKDIIDILIGARDKNQFAEISNILEEKGFVTSKKNKNDIYQFFSSTASETSSGDVHIHLVILNTERYSEFIILKEYLLQNKEEALNYSNFKKEIINKGITNRREYKAVKSEYVTNLLTRAKEWYSKLI